MAEQLICNQQVDGSTPFTSSNVLQLYKGDFPSGQRGQTVNLLSTTSLVRIQHPPPQTTQCASIGFFVCGGGCSPFGLPLMLCIKIWFVQLSKARVCLQGRALTIASLKRESGNSHQKIAVQSDCYFFIHCESNIISSRFSVYIIAAGVYHQPQVVSLSQ